jgi:hypothetical protein
MVASGKMKLKRATRKTEQSALCPPAKLKRVLSLMGTISSLLSFLGFHKKNTSSYLSPWYV